MNFDARLDRALGLNEASRRDLFRRLKRNSSSSGDATSDTDVPVEPSSGTSKVNSRRDFMKKIGGAAMMAGRDLNPMLNLASQAAQTGKFANAFSSLSTEELLETPEHLWLDKISPARAAQIAKEFPEHGKEEAVAKIIKVLTYGIVKHATNDTDTARRMSETSKDASKALMEIGKRWRLTGSDLVKHFENQGVDDEYLKNFSNFIVKNASRYGIKQDISLKKKSDQKSKPVTTQPDYRNDRYDYDTDRWADDGGANFESKLRKALGIVEYVLK